MLGIVSGYLAQCLDRLITLGFDTMRQLAPEIQILERVVGHGRVTAAGRRVLEADLGIMDFWEGGDIVNTIDLEGLLATEIWYLEGKKFFNSVSGC